MRKLLLTLDDTLDEFLKGEVNQSETIRNALHLYKDNISTPDTVAGIQGSYKSLKRMMDDKFEYYDQCFSRMDKLIKEIESQRNFG